LLTDLAGDRLVILSTHIVSDVEASASAIAILAGGTLRYHGTPEQLIARAMGHVWEWTVDPATLPEVRARHALSAALRRPDGVRVRAVGAVAPTPAAVPVAPELEDAYAWCLAPSGEH
jgi:ABC-2 type transport system ATP-binding protein